MQRTFRYLSTTAAVAIALLAFSLQSAAAAAPASVSDLAWMTGSWAGPAGPGRTLEENWIVPTGGSIASLVRITAADATPMVELIVIEEEDDTLVLRIQQWDPGLTPRSSEPQVMILSELAERSVKFEATSEGGLRSLAYSSPDANRFNINVETADGNLVLLPLTKQTRSN